MPKKSKWRNAATKDDMEQVAAAHTDVDRPPRAGSQNFTRIEHNTESRTFYDSFHDQLLNSEGPDNGDEYNEQEHNESHRLISSDGPDLGRAEKWHPAGSKFKRNKMSWRPNSLIILIVASTFAACGLILMLRWSFDEANLEYKTEPSEPPVELVQHGQGHEMTHHIEQVEPTRDSRWLVSTPKCHIPLLEPWDKSIESYVHKSGPMNCSAILDDVISGRIANSKNWTDLMATSMSYVRENKLYFTDTALKWGALANDKAAGQCCFKRVSRVTSDDDKLEQGRCEPIMKQGVSVNSSVIEVICAAWNYTNVHSFIVHDQLEEEALARVGRERLSKDDDHYSVLLIGVDTISRLNGRRQLNRTLKTLKRYYDALDFVGYNKVGENTFPNLIPLLTGLTPEQLTQIQCWEAKNYTRDESGDDYLDNCKFLWNFYQQIGYLTYLGEDWPSASTFNYLKPGFKYEPTAFYGRPFTLAREHLVYPKWNSPGCASCQLDRPLVEVDIENLQAFIENNTNKLPYFAMQWFNCPQHDDLNGASQVDHVFERFFKRLSYKLQMDRTFVIFFSDHGYRWNDFVSTRVGHYESSLPLLTIAPPLAFIRRHPELYKHMKSHRNSLLTPFDMFKTLIDLKELSSGGRKTMERDKREQQIVLDPQMNTDGVTILPEKPAEHMTNTVAISNRTEATDANTQISQLKPIDGTRFKQNFTILSLFDAHTAEQLNRGCIDAGIPDNYCVCHQFQSVALSSLDVLGAAYYLVYVHFDARLKEHLDICHPLDFESLHTAEMYNFTTRVGSLDKTRRKRTAIKSDPISSGPNKKTSARPTRKHLHGSSDDLNRHNYLPQVEYSIMVSTKPGGGLFKEVVRYYGSNMTSCELEVAKTRNVIEDQWATKEDKHESVLTMNDVCDFSVHGASISRFNLYKDQSKCVTSNTELKKICYCRDIRK